MSVPFRSDKPDVPRRTIAGRVSRASASKRRGCISIACLGWGAGIAAAALCWPSLALADPPAPNVPAPAAGTAAPAAPTAEQTDGPMPSHIPPILYGTIDQLAPGATKFRLAAADQPGQQAGPVNVVTHAYTKIYRLSVIEPGTLQHGDSVLIQGRADPDAKTFQALRIYRSATKVGLAPGIDLLDSVPASAPASPNGTDAFGSLGAAVKGTSAPAAPDGANAPDVKSKLVLRAQKRIDQALKRGLLTGLVVSANPLVVELYTGETIPVNPLPRNVTLDQVAMHLSDLNDGATVQVKGSEVAPGILRAEEINILPPDLPRADLATGRRNGLRRQRRRILLGVPQ